MKVPITLPTPRDWLVIETEQIHQASDPTSKVYFLSEMLRIAGFPRTKQIFDGPSVFSAGRALS